MHSRSKPGSDVSVLARVAELPEDSSIQQQIHDRLERERSVIGSTSEPELPATEMSSHFATSC